MVLEVVHKWTPQSTDCGNRGGVDNGVAAGQGVRWECCEKCSGPRDAANTRGPSHHNPAKDM